jgi:hypothetical protein
MSDRVEGLPPEIQERLASFIGDRVDGTPPEDDMRGLITFIVENADAHPALLNLVKVDEKRMMEHVKETGNVPPGVKIVQTSTVEGENVTKVRIFHGPTTIPEDQRS